MAKAVILAGGQGERFWPLTHKKFPKYRIKFEGRRSLLQNTSDRLAKVYGKKNIYVVTTASHAPMIREELPGLPEQNLIIEPCRNNTAPAIYLACERLRKVWGDKEVVSFFPADALIQNKAAFARTMGQASRLAAKHDSLVTVGIRPTFPATGYGYIEKGGPIKGAAGSFHVRRFVEKPDLTKAKRYLHAKKFYWNAGMFTWRLDVFFKAMHRHCPAFEKTFDLVRLGATYKKLPSISIDYALMEKAKNIAVCTTSMDWCDMGSWEMLFERSPRAKGGVYAEGFHYHQDVTDSLVLNQTGLPLVLLGVSGIVAVQTSQGTLICRKGRSQEAALLAKKLG